ncbi:unnamed protein product [Tenebrio molitor]|nr:unnamed protein product [Tenebrio molitor]
MQRFPKRIPQTTMIYSITPSHSYKIRRAVSDRTAMKYAISWQVGSKISPRLGPQAQEGNHREHGMPL